MAKNQHTFAKRQREMEKKRKAEEKRAKRREKSSKGDSTGTEQSADESSSPAAAACGFSTGGVL